MRTFRSNSEHGPTDIIIEPDGQVWVTVEPGPAGKNVWWGAYEKIEVLRGKDYRRGGNSERDGRRGGQRTGRTSRSYPGKPESKYGIRDHCPVDPQIAEQARLYAQMYKEDKSGLYRKLYGG